MAEGAPNAEEARLPKPVPAFIYLDYAATAPLCEEAALAMEPFQVPGPESLACNANANALYGLGRAAFDFMEGARRRVARALGARRPDEIIFTSGATEADDAALIGLVHGAAQARRLAGQGSRPLHVVTSAIEHDAVLAPCKRLEAEGVRVTYLRPNRQGFIEVDALKAALTEDTVLVSVQMANSEVGSIQPIRELVAAAHGVGALFHTDAVQALGKMPVNLADLDVDAASFSAHKVGGPKGVGALYLRARTTFEPYLLGGGQESGRRSGTQNVAGIMGFAAACEAAVAAEPDESARLRALRDGLYAALAAADGVSATVAVEPGSEDFLPNIVHVLADEWESETMVLRFDKLGVCVAGGSACSSHSLEPSHVLRAMGISGDEAYNALRVSMGRYTTEADIEAFKEALNNVLNW
ncbi:cysteine desulfurase family protein [Adlercreutzia sp. R25]|uniref:cysteine desulfurase n=1 Tax=Adlercreutzia shanghongiae TaxID=3111773 RepID=A0ABU6IXJ5_9ACTN|nr:MULTISPECIES: cysteine desulfurase family protein [unclassified Adlercreutzia]MEC4272518.1 cysteine desulfurase family protein [Adlercreutzia sp. R25]MEC4294582.1 cysteine desulfurase family protein [Adlercreutzia sp. R22]